MTSPPLHEQQNVSHGPGSSDRFDTPEDQEFDVLAGLRQLFPTSWADPTGQKALRNIQKQLGYIEPDAELELRIKSKSRGIIGIRLDYEIKGFIAELLGRFGQISETRSRNGYRARVRPYESPTKNNPGAVEKFGDSDNTGAHIKTNL